LRERREESREAKGVSRERERTKTEINRKFEGKKEMKTGRVGKENEAESKLICFCGRRRVQMSKRCRFSLSLSLSLLILSHHSNFRTN